MTPIISVDNLSKTYASGLQALKNINLEIRRGEIFALLGPNGAGKTTLIGTICGIVNPTEGRVLVGGQRITAEQQRFLRPDRLRLRGQVPHHRLVGHLFGLRVEILQRLLLAC